MNYAEQINKNKSSHILAFRFDDSEETINKIVQKRLSAVQKIVNIIDDCPSCGKKEIKKVFWKKIQTKNKLNNFSKSKLSESIKQSWEDPEVAAARSKRHSVFVKGHGSFRSLRAAFVVLGLPLEKHIKFRVELKQEKRKTFFVDGKSYHFSI